MDLVIAIITRAYKALNQAAALPARTILATALNSPRIDWLGC